LELPVRLVEAFDECVLFGLPGRDETKIDLLGLGPIDQGMARQLAAVVEPQRGRSAMQLDQLIHHPIRSLAEDRGRDPDPQRLAIAVVEHVRSAEALAVVERVVHEVERLDAVELDRSLQGQGLPGGQEPLRPARDD